MRRLVPLFTLALLAATPALAQDAPASAAPASAAAPPMAPMMGGGGGLPPFLAKMQHHDVDVRVLRDGGAPAPADLSVVFSITAGGASVRDFREKTGADGVAHFAGIPTNPEVQDEIGYQIAVEADGVRFPFEVERVPTDGGHLEVSVPTLGTDTSHLRLEYGMVEMFPDEESLVIRQEMHLINEGDTAVNLATLPGGGLTLHIPEGAKHPELHEDTPEDTVEVRGTDLVYKGVVLPAKSGPAVVRVIYTVDYGPRTFAWRQTQSIPTSGGIFVVSKDKQPQQQEAIPLELVSSDPNLPVHDSELDGNRHFQVARGDALKLGPGQPLRFEVRGLPAAAHSHELPVILGAFGVVAGVVLLGFRRPASAPERLSRAHLETERDRLEKALARMRKAVTRGHMTQARFEREREAITARLVSLYRALDRLDAH
jgi:hypothetical protein